MIMDDYDGQMIFGNLGGLKLPDICLTGEEIPRKNLTQETFLGRGSNPGPLHDRCTCCRLTHSGGPVVLTTNPHLKTGVDSTPETLCEKHFRQQIPYTNLCYREEISNGKIRETINVEKLRTDTEKKRLK